MQVPPLEQSDASEGIKAAKSLGIPVYRLGSLSQDVAGLALELVWRPEGSTEQPHDMTLQR